MIVTADDSTGATEAAALCADAGMNVVVAPFGVGALSDCVVVDLRSRHLQPDEARRRISVVCTPAHRVHKIDSTLRGNWAAELSALAAGGRRIVLIPAHPLAGRVCRDGVVYVDGVPVADTAHGSDPRLPVRSSRPSQSLVGDELPDGTALSRWLAAGVGRISIVDAETVDAIDEVVAVALLYPDVVLAGPASVVGAAARHFGSGLRPRPLPTPWLPGPTVVVCASLHPISREQIARLVDVGLDVVASSEVRRADFDVVAAELAERAHQRVEALQANSVILVGGDTAAAFIGDNVVRLFGSLDVGVSLGEVQIGGRQLRVACKNGGFGTAGTLVDLVRG